MDFIEGLPFSFGKQVIFIVVDRLSKAVHFMALSHPYTAADVAQCFLDNVFKLHGFPHTITNDRDPIFVSHFWTANTIANNSFSYVDKDCCCVFKLLLMKAIGW